MGTLSSSSTLAEVQAAYDDNASYASDNSATKAGVFITACRILLNRLPMQSQRAGSAFQLDKQSLREQLTRAEQWVAAHGGAGSSSGISSSRHLSFQDFRT
jgi:hypothetical protein